MPKFLEFIQTDFWRVAPILAAGGIALAILFERVPALVWRYPLRQREAFFARLRELVLANQIAEAIAYCDGYGHKPAVQVVREALARADRPEIMIEDGVEIAINDAMEKINKRTGFLSTIANVATLLGLLGTVAGLISSFEAVGGANPQQKAQLLAAGISMAMNATMMGLGVAIPCMIAFSFLMNRTNRIAAEIEQCGVKAQDLLRQRYYFTETGIAPQKKTG